MYNLEQIYEDVLPELNILERRPSPANKPTNHPTDEPFKSKAEQMRNTVESQSPSKRKNSVVQNDLDRLGPANWKQDDTSRKTNPKFNNEASKNLITEMLNKISLKSVSEENYPISNQTIERLMLQLEAEIKVLNIERDKFANSLLLNPSNQHLKKELQAMDKNLNQIKTIKDLYKEKIQYRNKISDLESKIMELKIQNRELKIKIERGIQKIESHIHNLPCEKQKELIEEVNKYREALQREKQMRINLETNINSINLNYKRFYDEADAARKIVGQQLKKIAAKEQELNAKVEKLSFHRCEYQQQSETKSGTPLKRMGTNRPNQEQNIADAINMINRQESNMYKQSFPSQLLRNNSNREAEGRVRSYTQQGFVEGTQKYKGKRQEQIGPVRELQQQRTAGGFNLSEQIEKMRMNQAVFSKLNKKKM